MGSQRFAWENSWEVGGGIEWGPTPNKLPLLRQRYIAEVEYLADLGLSARAAGVGEEATARMLHSLRREIGVEYKKLTPPEMQEIIRQRNLQRYSDPLGPTIEYFREQNKSWQEIIDSASRSGGKDLGF